MIFLLLLLFCTPSLADEPQKMKFLGYEEIEDCPYPSEKIEVVDDHGNVSYLIKSPCEKEKK